MKRPKPASDGIISDRQSHGGIPCTLLVVFLLFMGTCAEIVVGMSIQPVNARRGAKHIQGKSVTIDSIASPEAIQDLCQKNNRRVPGSKKYDAGWRNWCKAAIDAIRCNLSNNLPYEADAEGFGALFYNLGQAADRGEMPSFADPGSRAGYSLEFFCRARLIADMFVEKYIQPSTAGDVFFSKFCSNNDDDQTNRDATTKTCRVLSLGGGPGYDYVGILLADTFLTSGFSKTRIEGVVFDYEEGWQDLVIAMNRATQSALLNDNLSRLEWGGGCDITKPLSDPSNAACQREVKQSDVIICQYCVAENANRLRESDFSFFRDVFDEASNECTIVITEVTPRIWPEIVDVLLQMPDGGKGFTIDFLRSIKRSLGPQLVIQKSEGATICPEELAACNEFRRLRELHERKINNGFRRQPKKVRGAKTLETTVAV